MSPTTNIKSAALNVSVKNAGAELCSVKDNEGTEYIWQARKEIWPRHAPVLFPVVGKLKDDTFTAGTRQFRLPQHGFARDMEFTLLKQSETSCTHRLQSNAETRGKYPFSFTLDITHTIEDRNLEIQYEIKAGDTGLDFSIGAHPGFACPLYPHEQFEDYTLHFPRSAYNVSVLENGLRSGIKKKFLATSGKLKLSPQLFDNDALVFEGGQIDEVSLLSPSGKGVTLKSAGWPYYGIWSRKGCREFVCLEPWHGIADSTTASGNISEKEGIISLEPDDQFDCSFSITFH